MPVCSFVITVVNGGVSFLCHSSAVRNRFEATYIFTFISRGEVLF